MRSNLTCTALFLGTFAATAPHAPAQDLRVVTSLPTYAAIAREIVGGRAEVRSIAEGDENPHFVKPKPSYVALLARADLFVTTGLDLELWVPTLLDKANNRKIIEGGPGYVTAYTGIRLLDVPPVASRAAGDIHIYGNPHIHTDPINAILIARNILVGLRRVAPEHADEFAEREADFERRVLERLVGARLLEILGPQALFEVANSDRFWSFLETTELQGAPLVERLGGWLAEGAPFRGKDLVCYHKLWAYFSARFQIPCVAYAEPKPGIPPSPRHVESVLAIMRTRSIKVFLAANFWDRNQVRTIAQRAGARAVIVPEHVEGAPGVQTYFDLVDLWVRELAQAFTAGAGAATSGGQP
jgi:ABC-type Zn uptake system ZnuABC Zn-binding protein ZnuA